MILDLNSIDIRQDFDRIKMLHWGHFIFIFFQLLMDIFTWEKVWGDIFQLFFFLCFYRFYFFTLKELNYSFWAFSFFVGLYLLFQLMISVWIWDSYSFLSSFLGLVMLIFEAYLLSTPIYYPKINWKEYDFRYRYELKVNISCGEIKKEGRLIDLGRSSGCVVLFDDFDLGENLILNSRWNTRVVSKREDIIGRGIYYGINFSIDSHEDRLMFQELLKEWKERKKTVKKRT